MPLVLKYCAASMNCLSATSPLLAHHEVMGLSALPHCVKHANIVLILQMLQVTDTTLLQLRRVAKSLIETLSSYGMSTGVNQW